jgi:predicted homoserine dehydrogenase-like protein
MATSFSVGTSADFPLGANFARDVIRVGVIGYGYWGPNIVRNFQGHEKADVVAVCDKNPKSPSRPIRWKF